MGADVQIGNFESLCEHVATAKHRIAIVSAVNYEERSLSAVERLLRAAARSGFKNVDFRVFRLLGGRPDPFSVLELLKRQYEEHLQNVAKDLGKVLHLESLVHPATISGARELLRFQSCDELVIDLSTVPLKLGIYLADVALGIAGEHSLTYHKVSFVFTPPERLIGRDGVGPFEVGAIELTQHDHALHRAADQIRWSLLTFLGPEGFEARSAVDAVRGPRAHVTVAVDLGSGGMDEVHRNLARHMSLVVDGAEGRISLKYYFSLRDAVELAVAAGTKAADACSEYPNLRHGFLVAPFWPPSAILLGCLARRAFDARAQVYRGNIDTFSDTMTLSGYQYVSMFSRGAGEPEVIELSSGSSGLR